MDKLFCSVQLFSPPTELLCLIHKKDYRHMNTQEQNFNRNVNGVSANLILICFIFILMLSTPTIVTF